MKRKQLLIFSSLLFIGLANVQAQGIFDKIKQSASQIASQGTGVTGNIVDALIGKKKLTEKDLQGTWVYQEPAIAFESENVLKKAGGAITADIAEKKLGATLTQYGFKLGEVILTFGKDQTYTCTIKGRSITGKYTIEGATVKLKKGGITAVKANTKRSGKHLQMSFQANALLKGMSMLGNMASDNSKLRLISKFAGMYDGMQLGMKFAPKD